MVKATINYIVRIGTAMVDTFRFDFLRPPLPIRISRRWESYTGSFQQLVREATDYTSDYRSQARAFVLAMRLAKRAQIVSSTAGELGQTERALTSRDVDQLGERWTQARFALQQRRNQLASRAVAHFSAEIRRSYVARACSIHAAPRHGSFALTATVDPLGSSIGQARFFIDVESDSFGHLRELESLLSQLFESSEAPLTKYRQSGISIEWNVPGESTRHQGDA